MPFPTRKFSALESAQLVISQNSVLKAPPDMTAKEPGGTELGGDMLHSSQKGLFGGFG